MGTRAIVGLILTVVMAVALFATAGNLAQNVAADEIVVIQDLVDGDLHWYTQQGLKPQWFGTVTVYKKRNIYVFQQKVRFNDGGHGTMHGSIQYDMPIDELNLTNIHQKFGSQDALDAQLIKTVVDKAIYMSGPLMSSKESYAEKRNSLIWYVEDQATGGVYRTTQREVRGPDPLTGLEKTVTVVEIIEKRPGVPDRQEEAVLPQFGIKPFNFVITELPYDEAVEAQIKQQQTITMDVQTAMAEARKAEQRAVTAKAEGEANAARAKWEQEVVKAKAVTEAQQQKEVEMLSAQKRYEVAKLDADAADQYRVKKLREAEGDATYKKRVMEADGALAQRLATYERVSALFASAIQNHQGAWVPTVYMGGGGSAPASGGNSGASGGIATAASPAFDLISMLNSRLALDLAVDVKGSATNGR